MRSTQPSAACSRRLDRRVQRLGTCLDPADHGEVAELHEHDAKNGHQGLSPSRAAWMRVTSLVQLPSVGVSCHGQVLSGLTHSSQ